MLRNRAFISTIRARLGSSRSLLMGALGALCAIGCDKTEDREHSVDGGRVYRTVVRRDHDATKPSPLLIALHGYATDPSVLVDVYRLVKVAVVERDYVLAVPKGLSDSKGQPFWNAFPACCDHDHTNPDDVAYLHAVLESVKRSFAIDPKRVYAIGLSNGAFMAHRWATSRSDLRGIVAISGVDDTRDRTVVEPLAAPVRVLSIHGDADSLVRYDGGQMDAPHPPVRSTVAAWRVRNRCTEGTEPLRTERRDLFDHLTRTETWACGAATTALWTVVGGDHYLEPKPALTPAILDFLEGS